MGRERRGKREKRKARVGQLLVFVISCLSLTIKKMKTSVAEQNTVLHNEKKTWPFEQI